MKIFLSCVTPELGSYREAITKLLHGVDYEVRVQEYFRPGTTTLLEHLRNYIRECDLVILLIGGRCGAFPKDNEVKVIGPLAALQEFRDATKQVHASYTLWEFLLAHEFGKKALVFFTSDSFAPDKPDVETSDLHAAQQAYRSWIKELGLVRTPFATKEQLEKDVLRYFVPKESAGRPNNLPYHSLDELFKGRDEFIKTLRQSLARTSDRRATAIVQSRAVHGLGGVGKTRLAVEYAWRHATDHTALLFAGADSPENLRRNLAALVAPAVLNLPEHDRPHEDVRMAAAVRWLEQHPGWLLILDNVDTPEAAKEVQKTLPQFRHGHVLITSRRSQWSATVEPLELDKLAFADSADFLLERTAKQRRQTDTDRADAESLARELDGLALALEQAGAYIAQRHCSIAEYLAQWRAHDRAVQEWFDDTVMNYPRSVATTWETTLEQLGPGEVALLRMFAWFAPDPIPLFVLDGEDAEKICRAAASLFAEERGTKTEVTDTPRDAMVNLINYGMAKRGDGDEVIIHRVVQEILRNTTPTASRKVWLKSVAMLLRAAAPVRSGDVRTWPRWNPLRVHVEFCVAAADAEQIADPTGALMNNLAHLLKAKALYSEAEPLMRRALAIAEQSFGSEHPNVSICLNNLAELLQITNRRNEAEPLVRRALANDEQNLGMEHPNVATDLNNLAHLLEDSNRPLEAEPLIRRALSINEKIFGPSHSAVAISLNNLAALLMDTNRLAEAESLMRRALAINENTYGPEHPDVALNLSNLAHLLQAANRPSDAEPLIRRALAIDEKNLGPEHPNIAIRLNNLAQLIKRTNPLAEVEGLMRRGLAIEKKCKGENHPHVAIQLSNLAELFRTTGRQREAEPLYRRALAIDEESFGPTHPNVARDLNNLALLLAQTNRMAEAEPLMCRALEVLVKSLGSKHPNLQGVIRNYFELLMAKGLSQEQATKAVAEVMAAVSRKNG